MQLILDEGELVLGRACLRTLKWCRQRMSGEREMRSEVYGTWQGFMNENCFIFVAFKKKF